MPENTTSPQMLTFFSEAHHVSLTVLPGSERAKQMTVTSGQKWLELYARRSPVPSFLRTLLTQSTWYSPLCYLTWKARAIPRCRQWLFQLVPSEPHTDATGYSWWPTPTASDDVNRRATNEYMTGNQTYRRRNLDGTQSFLQLGRVVKLWALPTASTAKRSGKWGSRGHAHDLSKGNLKGQVIEPDGNTCINPAWELMLMGFPADWLDIGGQQDRVRSSSIMSHSGRSRRRTLIGRTQYGQSATLLCRRSSIHSHSPSTRCLRHKTA
jgi:hypothetical protein